MISVKGKIKNGVALPLQPVKKTDEGRSVIITFMDDDLRKNVPKRKNGSQSLEDLISKCEMDTGISDLASQHDHYLYGTPKK